MRLNVTSIKIIGGMILMTTKTTTNRNDSVIVKLSPVIKAKLQAHCEVLGVSMSGFVAVIIGQILKQATSTEETMMGIMEKMAKEQMMDITHSFNKKTVEK
jgi:hypothetical protein